MKRSTWLAIGIAVDLIAVVGLILCAALRIHGWLWTWVAIAYAVTSLERRISTPPRTGGPR